MTFLSFGDSGQHDQLAPVNGQGVKASVRWDWTLGASSHSEGISNEMEGPVRAEEGHSDQDRL